MLKEGWDVTNLYTIVPLRAANARVLMEPSIGRGLRLPYGKRTGVNAVDRLNIIAHDRFEEIVDEAKQPDFTAIVAKTTEVVIQQTIDVPRILVVPTGQVPSGFNPFTLNLTTLKYPTVSEELWAKHLRTDQVDVQMQEYYWEKANGCEVKANKGFCELEPSAYTASAFARPRQGGGFRDSYFGLLSGFKLRLAVLFAPARAVRSRSPVGSNRTAG
jgi:restriction endonuclease